MLSEAKGMNDRSRRYECQTNMMGRTIRVYTWPNGLRLMEQIPN